MTAVAEDVDLSALVDDVLPCWSRTCENVPTWGLLGTCHDDTKLLCDFHRESVFEFFTLHNPRLWRCATCKAPAPAPSEWVKL